MALTLALTAVSGCQTAASGELKPISAADLTQAYGMALADVRRRYDGKEIVVRGYVSIPAVMPKEPNDEGSLALRVRKDKPEPQVICWFSHDQDEQFSNIDGDRYVTVKGVFNGEAGLDLKFCKLIKIE